MSYMRDIAAAIEGLSKWECSALAAACAESVSPIVTRFAEPMTRSTATQGLDAVWRSIGDQKVDPRARPARLALDDLPEANAGDSNLPSYDVMTAISVLADALDAIVDGNPQRATRDACAGATNIYAGFDVILSPVGSLPVRIDPRNPPPAGRFELLQTHAQFGLIKQFGNSAPLGQAVEQARASARQLARELDAAMASFTERRGWHV